MTKQNTLRFDHWTPQAIAAAAEKYKTTAQSTYDAVAKAEVSIAAIIDPLHALGFRGYVDGTNLEFLQHVSPDPVLREASVAADKVISEFEVTQSMRVDLFKQFEKLSGNLSGNLSDPETLRFIERQLREGRRNGLHLDEKVFSYFLKFKFPGSG